MKKTPSLAVVPKKLLIFGFICLAALATLVSAQQRTELKVADTSSPRDTLKSFIDACNDVNELINEAGFFDRETMPANALRRA